jgi:hypothetical protein
MISHVRLCAAMAWWDGSPLSQTSFCQVSVRSIDLLGNDTLPQPTRYVTFRIGVSTLDIIASLAVPNFHTTTATHIFIPYMDHYGF